MENTAITFVKHGVVENIEKADGDPITQMLSENLKISYIEAKICRRRMDEKQSLSGEVKEGIPECKHQLLTFLVTENLSRRTPDYNLKLSFCNCSGSNYRGRTATTTKRVGK